MHACMYACMHACTHAFIHARARVHAHTRARTLARLARVRAGARAHTNTSTRVRAHNTHLLAELLVRLPFYALARLLARLLPCSRASLRACSHLLACVLTYQMRHHTLPYRKRCHTITWHCCCSRGERSRARVFIGEHAYMHFALTCAQLLMRAHVCAPVRQ